MKKIVWIVVILLGGYIFLEVNNQWLVTTEYVYEAEEIPESFDGFRIVQVSDLHDAQFGSQQQRLINKVEQQQPDAIFLTGDLIDSNRYDLEQSLQAVEAFVDMAPVYYVLGNHEVATNLVDDIYARLEALGVETLKNEAVTLTRVAQTMTIAGIEDPLMNTPTEEMLVQAFHDVPDAQFSLLLAHRPEMVALYGQSEADVVFTGHAHGGQIRIPFVGGLIAPGQGYFPQYTSGRYDEGTTTMYLSRGLGNSVVPYRIFNLPEIVVVELRKS
ncbi:metallophosphoesterase [Caryophanon tenue]|uniref:Phosphoesterase n=1 Tax=Caryophanon tenue TaxID=33978 RepID=A0A1C0YHM0_9BACL|nr:metallophosphoesterase [Caryophanon tenue]OCS86613.1 phosphoesterase [Caryophanon tenue]